LNGLSLSVYFGCRRRRREAEGGRKEGKEGSSRGKERAQTTKGTSLLLKRRDEYMRLLSLSLQGLRALYCSNGGRKRRRRPGTTRLSSFFFPSLLLLPSPS